MVPTEKDSEVQSDEIKLFTQAPDQFESSQFFKSKWLPKRANCQIMDQNAFIHAVNLGVCGPLFSDIQTFLRVYAMTKRISLL